MAKLKEFLLLIFTRKLISIEAKIFLLSASISLAAFLSIGITMWINFQVEGAAAAINEAGRLRMQSYRLYQLSTDTTVANRQQQVQQNIAYFNRIINLLEFGDSQRDLKVPWNAKIKNNFNLVKRNWQQYQTELVKTQPRINLDQIEHYVADIDKLVQSVEDKSKLWVKNLHYFLFFMVFLAILCAITALYVGYKYILFPIFRIRQGIANFKDTRNYQEIAVVSNDEIAMLTKDFNEMTQTLATFYDDLEIIVQQQTADLHQQQKQLQSLYEISTKLSAAESLTSLTADFAMHLCGMIGADAVVVRLYNKQIKKHVLVASYGIPKNIAEEDCLPLGVCDNERSFDNKTTNKYIPIINYSLQKNYGCARLGFKGLFSIPIKSHGKVIGEVDLFYQRANVVLDSNTHHLVDTLVSHLATGIESINSLSLIKEAAVAQERNLLAQELHDSIAQSLAFLKIQLKLLKQARKSQDQARQDSIIDEIQLGINESNNDVRELLLHFRVRTNTTEIEPEIIKTLNKLELQSKIKTELIVTNYGIPLPPDIQIQVLHIIQEALSNIRKHANASKACVKITQSPHWIIEIIDNGIGFEVEDVKHKTGHIGLTIMSERAKRINAKFEVFSTVNQGTKIKLTLPFNINAVN